MSLDAILTADTLARAAIVALVLVAIGCLRAWMWDRAEQRKLVRARERAGLEESRRAIYDSEPPADPPRIGPVVALVLGLGALEIGYAGPRPALTRAIQSRPLHHLPAPRADERCSPPCPRNQSCVSGVCSVLTEDGRGPQSAGLLSPVPLQDIDPWAGRL